MWRAVLRLRWQAMDTRKLRQWPIFGRRSRFILTSQHRRSRSPWSKTFIAATDGNPAVGGVRYQEKLKRDAMPRGEDRNGHTADRDRPSSPCSAWPRLIDGG